jgi:hypothetical protein
MNAHDTSNVVGGFYIQIIVQELHIMIELPRKPIGQVSAADQIVIRQDLHDLRWLWRLASIPRHGRDPTVHERRPRTEGVVKSALQKGYFGFVGFRIGMNEPDFPYIN